MFQRGTPLKNGLLNYQLYPGWVGVAASPAALGLLEIAKVVGSASVIYFGPCTPQTALTVANTMPSFGVAILIDEFAAVEFAVRCAVHLRPPVLLSKSFGETSAQVAQLAARAQLQPRRIEPRVVKRIHKILDATNRGAGIREELLEAAAKLFGVAMWPDFQSSAST
jgi:hypothetical protein